MNNIAVIPVLAVLVLLAGGFAAFPAARRNKTTGNIIALAASGLSLALLLGLVPSVLFGGNILSLWLGGWAPLHRWAVGQSIQVDALGLLFALLIVGTAVLSRLAALTEPPQQDKSTAKATTDPPQADTPLSPALALLATAAATALVLSGELSTIFVTMELLSISAVALTVSHYKHPGALAAALRQQTVGAVASGALLVGLCLSYSQYHSLNLAQMAAKTPSEGDNLMLSLAFALLFTSFAVRALLFPFHTLRPEPTRDVSPSASLLIGDIMTKCGVYGMVRMLFTVFQSGNRLPVSWLVSGLGGVSMVLCTLMAFRQRTLYRFLSLHAAAQTGRAVLLIGLCTALGLGAGLYQLLHLSLTLPLLLLAAALLERETGTAEMKRLDGAPAQHPRIMTLFLVGSASLCGLPPFGGFTAQWMAVQALFQRATLNRSIFFTLALVLYLITSVLTALSLLQLLARFCFGRHNRKPDKAQELPAAAQLPLWLLSLGCLLTGLLAGPIIDHILLPAVSAAANIPAYVDASFGEGFARFNGVPGGAMDRFHAAHPWALGAWLLALLILVCAVVVFATLTAARQKSLENSDNRTIRRLMKNYPILAVCFARLHKLSETKALRTLHRHWDRCTVVLRQISSLSVNDACLCAVAALAVVTAVCMIAI